MELTRLNELVLFVNGQQPKVGEVEAVDETKNLPVTLSLWKSNTEGFLEEENKRWIRKLLRKPRVMTQTKTHEETHITGYPSSVTNKPKTT